MFKKYFVMLIALTFCLSLAACHGSSSKEGAFTDVGTLLTGGGEVTQTPDSNPLDSSGTVVPEIPVVPGDGTVQMVDKEKQVEVVTQFKPAALSKVTIKETDSEDGTDETSTAVFIMDDKGRYSKISSPQTDEVQSESIFEYNSNGQLSKYTQTAAQNEIVRYDFTYDANGMLSSADVWGKYPLNNVMTLKGEVTFQNESLVPPDGQPSIVRNVSSYAFYDKDGNKIVSDYTDSVTFNQDRLPTIANIVRSDKDASLTSMYKYNDSGLVEFLFKRENLGQTGKVSYNTAGKPDSIIITDNATKEVVGTITGKYDGKGRLIEETYVRGTQVSKHTFEYNDNAIAPPLPFVFNFIYSGGSLSPHTSLLYLDKPELRFGKNGLVFLDLLRL